MAHVIRGEDEQLKSTQTEDSELEPIDIFFMRVGNEEHEV